MTSFGDFTPEDAYDPAPADTDAVVRWFLRRLGRRRTRRAIVAALRELVEHLRREGSLR